MAEALDILTLAEGRATLNQGTQTTEDSRIAALISAISQRLDDTDDGIGPVITRTITDETHDGEGVCIRLEHRPVTSIVSVVEDTTTLTTADWHIDYGTGLLTRQSGDYDYPWCDGLGNIVVTYRAGRYAATANVPERYKQGARLFLKHMWRAEQWHEDGLGDDNFDVPQVAFPGFAVPNAVREWFGSDWSGRKGGFA